MIFTSVQYLFVFFPIFLLIWLVIRTEFRVAFVIIANLIFIYLGSPQSLIPLITLAVVSFLIGRTIQSRQEKGLSTYLFMWLGILATLVLLFVQKILTAHDSESFIYFETSFLPMLGLSYISFQLISFFVDTARDKQAPPLNFLEFCAFILFFPKLVSGPITRFKPFAEQLRMANAEIDNVVSGIRRIFLGTIKTLLIANQIGAYADAVFNLQYPNIEPVFAWLALIAYTFQIYFDFSGYTDIALGLGRMMGMILPENFNHPYISQSITEFWRRWHISLSNWFRDYVFFPLQRRKKVNIMQLNLFVVFLLTGLWHGFTVNYLIWGGIHGIMIAVESLGNGQWQKAIWRPLRHVFTLAIVMLGWVFFRSSSFEFAINFIGRLLGNQEGVVPLPFSVSTPLPFIEPSFVLALFVAVLFSFPVSSLTVRIRSYCVEKISWLPLTIEVLNDLILVVLFVLSIASQLSGASKPNIYAAY